jgi:hypothetical protein
MSEKLVINSNFKNMINYLYNLRNINVFKFNLYMMNKYDIEYSIL